MNAPLPFLDLVSARHLIRGSVVGALGLLSACASTGTSVSGFDQLNLKPGDTGQCDSSPCQVFLQIPAGTGSYVVTGNEATIGTYPSMRPHARLSAPPGRRDCQRSLPAS